MNAATMIPTHDHTVDSFGWSDYNHDPRCMGECYRCGGCHTPYPDTPALRCMYCDHGECGGCNLYRMEQARERGLCV